MTTNFRSPVNVTAANKDLSGVTSQRATGDRVAFYGKEALRYSVAGVLGWIGAMKFTAYEASAIQGLVASSPLTSWLYDLFSLQGAANFIGSIEIATAVLIVAGTRFPQAALAGALGALATFLVTLSFLITAPGWEASLGGFPALSVVPGQFLLKDTVLLAAAVWLAGDALKRLNTNS
ncbi:MAG: YkgB family protein [Methyloligellaceae bacterium]